MLVPLEAGCKLLFVQKTIYNICSQHSEQIHGESNERTLADIQMDIQVS